MSGTSVTIRWDHDAYVTPEEERAITIVTALGVFYDPEVIDESASMTLTILARGQVTAVTEVRQVPRGCALGLATYGNESVDVLFSQELTDGMSAAERREAFARLFEMLLLAA